MSAKKRVFARRPEPRNDLWAWSPTRLGSTEIEVCATRSVCTVTGRTIYVADDEAPVPIHISHIPMLHVYYRIREYYVRSMS